MLRDIRHMTGMADHLFAADEYNVSNGLTLNGVPLGFYGVDVVAATTDSVVLNGAADIAMTYDGVDYYFATEAAQANFEADPKAYLPQFGGFCALGVALTKKLDGSPRYADIPDGKLYVFVSQSILDKYKGDPAGTIAQAEENWKSIENTPITEL